MLNILLEEEIFSKRIGLAQTSVEFLSSKLEEILLVIIWNHLHPHRI